MNKTSIISHKILEVVFFHRLNYSNISNVAVKTHNRCSDQLSSKTGETASENNGLGRYDSILNTGKHHSAM